MLFRIIATVFTNIRFLVESLPRQFLCIFQHVIEFLGVSYLFFLIFLRKPKGFCSRLYQLLHFCAEVYSYQMIFRRWSAVFPCDRTEIFTRGQRHDSSAFWPPSFYQQPLFNLRHFSSQMEAFCHRPGFLQGKVFHRWMIFFMHPVISHQFLSHRLMNFLELKYRFLSHHF